MADTAKNDFRALYEVTQTISAIVEPRQLLDKVLDIALSHLEAERGFLLLTPGAGQNFEVTAARNFSGEGTTTVLAASSSVVSKVLSTGESVLTFDAMSDKEFESSRSVVAQKIRSIICVPLHVGESVIGAVYLDSTKARGKFNDDTLKFLTVFGHLAAIAIENARRYDTLREENERLRSQAQPSILFEGLVGKSRAWQSVLDILRRVATTDVSVLLTGESGTGKEVVARAIHDNSHRRLRSFVAVNCAAIPDQLLESELFGHTKGAFTGAHGDKKGLVEVAGGGSLFLDEIADLPPGLQTKILRLLQEREIRRVGDTEVRSVDVRIIAASNRDLLSEMRAGRFREDLYFRLNVVTIALPPLRERRDDIPILAAHFLATVSATHHRRLSGFTREAMQRMLSYSWPGNVRELQNVIERAVVLSPGDRITAEDLQLTEEHGTLTGGLTLGEFERRLVEKTLSENNGNRTRTAEQLGVSVRWLQYRLKEWNRE